MIIITQIMFGFIIKRNILPITAVYPQVLLTSNKLKVNIVQVEQIKAYAYTTSSEHHSKTKLEDLVNLGISKEICSYYPQLLDLKYGELSRNIKLLRELSLDDKAIAVLMLNSPTFIWKCYSICKRDQIRFKINRLQYISQELKIPQVELCSKLYKYKFVLSLSLQRIMKVVTVLLNHNVQPQDILSDFWVLRCKPESIESRLSRAENAEVENLKPWMGRCKDNVFESFMNRTATKHRLLGELSLEEYISQRLDRSADEIKEVIDREPQLQKTSVLKMKKILDFLFSSGFTASHILTGLPRVANRRIETIHARLQEMNEEGIPPSLYVLCKSKREYQHYINRKKKREPQ